MSLDLFLLEHDIYTKRPVEILCPVYIKTCYELKFITALLNSTNLAH